MFLFIYNRDIKSVTCVELTVILKITESRVSLFSKTFKICQKSDQNVSIRTYLDVVHNRIYIIFTHKGMV
jgi:hypothetical protein